MTDEEAKAKAAQMLQSYKAKPEELPPEGEFQTGFMGSMGRLGDAVRAQAGEIFGSMPTEEDISPILKNLKTTLESGDAEFGSGVGMLFDAILGGIDTMQSTKSTDGKVAPSNTAVMSALDTGTFGNLNNLIANSKATTALNAGVIDEEGYNAAFATALDEERLQEEESRAQNPMSGFGGTMVGGTVTGGLLAKGLLSAGSALAPRATRYLTRTLWGQALIGGAAAGLETGVYSINRDGELKPALRDAALGFIGGATITSLLGGVGLAYRSARGRVRTDIIEEGVGKEMLGLINLERKGAGQPEYTPAEVQKMVEDMGQGATLLDAFPALKTLADDVIKNDKGFVGSADKLHALVRARTEFAEDFLPLEGSATGMLSDTLGEFAVRSPTQFASDMSARFKTLSPRYTKIFAANSAVRFPITTVRQDLARLFGDKTKWSSAQLEVVEGINSNIDYFIRQTVQRTPGGTVKQTSLTLEQMTDIKSQLEKMVSEGQLRVVGQSAQGKTVPLSNKELYTVSNVARYFTDRLNVAVPELAVLNKVYGNIANVKGAHRAGQDIMKETGADNAAFDRFLANPSRSAAERRGFVEGAKQELFEQIRKKHKTETSTKAVSDFITSGPQVRKLKALLGGPQVDAMLKSMMPHVQKTVLADNLRKLMASPKRNRPGPASRAVQDALDLLVVGGGAGNFVSGAAGMGALRRSVTGRGSSNELAGQDQMMGSLLPTPAMTAGANPQPLAGPTYGALQQLLSRTVRPSDSRLILQGAGIGAGLPDMTPE